MSGHKGVCCWATGGKDTHPPPNCAWRLDFKEGLYYGLVICMRAPADHLAASPPFGQPTCAAVGAAFCTLAQEVQGQKKIPVVSPQSRYGTVE
eukprot:gene22699-biopygen10275